MYLAAIRRIFCGLQIAICKKKHSTDAPNVKGSEKKFIGELVGWVLN